MDSYARSVNLNRTEDNEFPILCETCLGPNNLIRMIKNKHGKTCKICENNFTTYKWKPGPKARYKNTIICQKCSKFKNLCQTCLFDLKYNLPVQVRDKYLNNTNELPESNVNLLYKLNNTMNSNENIYNDENNNSELLNKISRVAPYYRRNRPKICTFWLRNLCNRGEECPYLHESPDPNLEHTNKTGNINLNIKNRYKGQNDPLASKIFKQIEERDSNNKDNRLDSNSSNMVSNVEYQSMNPLEAIKRLE